MQADGDVFLAACFGDRGERSARPARPQRFFRRELDSRHRRLARLSTRSGQNVTGSSLSAGPCVSRAWRRPEILYVRRKMGCLAGPPRFRWHEQTHRRSDPPGVQRAINNRSRDPRLEDTSGRRQTITEVEDITLNYADWYNNQRASRPARQHHAQRNSGRRTTLSTNKKFSIKIGTILGILTHST